MSQHLPSINGRKIAAALGRAGFRPLPGRGKGSHIVLYHDQQRKLLTVPDHNPVRRGTLRSIIRQAGLSVKDFRQLL
jgi:predicted RNA binding protein YcfA (HicA-like mRNA interferase family)